MTFACGGHAPVLLRDLFWVGVCKINLALISFMIQLGTMTYWLMMLGVELLEWFHLAKVKVIAFLVETF